MTGTPETASPSPPTVDGMGQGHTTSRGIDDEAASLVAELCAAGHRGPILIVADNTAIARGGPAWAGALAARGWLHRVRVSTGIDGDDSALAAEAEALALEAHTLQATVIIGVGDRATCAAARAAAAWAGLPAVVRPTMPAD